MFERDSVFLDIVQEAIGDFEDALVRDILIRPDQSAPVSGSAQREAA